MEAAKGEEVSVGVYGCHVSTGRRRDWGDSNSPKSLVQTARRTSVSLQGRQGAGQEGSELAKDWTAVLNKSISIHKPLKLNKNVTDKHTQHGHNQSKDLPGISTATRSGG